VGQSRVVVGRDLLHHVRIEPDLARPTGHP
jgi:hypothetical protein